MMSLESMKKVNSQLPESFRNSFPNVYEIIPTEATGLQCGLHAIRHSIIHREHNLRTPTVEELHHIALTGVMAERVKVER